MNTQSLPLEIPAALPGVTLKVFVTSHSKWNETAILSEMHRVNQTFSKCGFGFNEIQLTRVENSLKAFDKPQVMNLLDSVEKENKRFAKELSLFFLNDFTGELARVSRMGASWGRNDQDPRAYSGFAVITDQALSARQRRAYAPDYSTIAHELGHILLNSNHVEYKNLMANRGDLLNGNLTEHQCAQINKDPFGLLVKNHKTESLAAKVYSKPNP